MFENEEDFFEALGLEALTQEDGTEKDAPVQDRETEAVPPEEEAIPEREAPPAETPRPDGSFPARVEEELRQIRQYDPSIRTPADLLRLDRREAFLREVIRHRHTFLEAYRFVYADRIAEQKARQAAQRARNSDLGKAHMRATTAAGSGGVTVPPEVEKNILAIMPKATPQQIRAFYRRYAKSTG